MDHTHDLERQAEEARLLARTTELRLRTEALDLNRSPFDPAAHEALHRDLEVHRQDLAKYRARFLETNPPETESS